MSGELDSYDHACEFWKRQVARGYKMTEWYASLNLKYREYYE